MTLFNNEASTTCSTTSACSRTICGALGQHRNDDALQTIILPVVPPLLERKTLPQPPSPLSLPVQQHQQHQQQQHQQQRRRRRSTEIELRRAAGGKCYDTFLEVVQGWTCDEIDTFVTTTQKSPIHMAAWKGNIQNLIYFIDILKCNINVISQMKYSYGKTPIFFALTQSRCDVVDYLLDRNANVKIINNKGQSPLSIASSHFYNADDIYMIDKIIQAEQQQSHIEWMNYRTSHSDSCIYGDLDPRHLERPLDVNHDIITLYAINPTTKAIRRSGLYRRLNNFTYENDDNVKSSEQQQSLLSSTTTTTTTKTIIQQRKRNIPKRELTPEDMAIVETAWMNMKKKNSILVTTSTSSDDDDSNERRMKYYHLWTILRIYSKLQKAWIPEVVEQLRSTFLDIDDNDDNTNDDNVAIIPQMFQELLSLSSSSSELSSSSSSSLVQLSKQDRILIRRVYNYYIDPSCCRQHSEVVVVNRVTNNTDSIQQLNPSWHDAFDVVKDLYLHHLITASIARSSGSSNDPTIFSSMSLPPQYLTLPYTPIWVDTIEQLLHLQEMIQHTSLVAIDAEWHDNDDNDDDNNNDNTNTHSMLSTLQIAIVQPNHNAETTNSNNENSNTYENDTMTTMVWVIDLLIHNNDDNNNACYRNTCVVLIREILNTKIVLGFSLSNDMKRLYHYCCNNNNNNDPSVIVSKCVLDIQSLWKQYDSTGRCRPSQMFGLARCFQDVIMSTNKKDINNNASVPPNNRIIVQLSKEYQCSNWSIRPLSVDQIQYAGLDAVIVLYLMAEQYRILVQITTKEYGGGNTAKPDQKKF